MIICPCGCGVTIVLIDYQENSAEILLGIADAVMQNPREILVPTGPDDNGQLARVKLALMLRQRKDICLRALVEDWDLETIVREIY